MNRFLLCMLLLLALCASALAQDTFDRYPRPYFIPFLSLNNGGFQPASFAFRGGLNYEGKHLASDVNTGYNFARKSNDGTVNNRDGYFLNLHAEAFARLSNLWLFGAYGGWARLSTTNYTKELRGGGFGGGRDLFLSDLSLRILAMYHLPYGDPDNGQQGPFFRLIMPSPLTQHHFYYIEETGVDIFHGNGQQLHTRSYSGSAQFGVMIKF
jgi:hypothetical protein